MAEPVHVIGATGRSGLALCRALTGQGRAVIAVVRNPTKWAATGIPGGALAADVDDPASLHRALAGASHVVSTLHASHTADILAAAPDARLVLLGSTRRFSAIPDTHGLGVLAGEQALLASGRQGVMLHPTMIYGGPDDATVQRLAALLRRLPLLPVRVLPLPGGGRSLVQPIHRSDVTRAILAALDHPWDGPHAMVIAGPSPLSYAAFVRTVARAAHLSRPMVVPLPVRPLLALSRLAKRLGWAQAGADEIRRLDEDKAFDITEMVQRLGVSPLSLADGLAREFPSTQNV